ncbi:efflux RND transporter periplasmic adaptor subunit [Psychroflexus lacisalsi]|jgi:RND family efflux transporter MFP subunit|uniref:Efflux RND transporter periplasmic adaptor subunit n=1 Tax=Psychroflexus lacisalsi TaxID=503928 RepID=A0ABP3V8D3_9FLAO|nr:efflux RND transporter periplasmic adaptor subunit [Psychroflexus lacisalsi]MBZ9620767.1 efflux RND transporter periplasmic adaptor subunit [Psychroflexus lacisalsi]
MKYISYLTLLSLVIIVSCGPKEKSIEDIVENGSKAELNQKREELNTSMRKLNSQIKTLDKKLADFEDTSKYALVEALSLVPKDFNHYVTVQGDVTTDQNIMIYPQFSGVLKDIYVKEGDQVKKGQKLAKIDDGGQSSQLEEMKAQRELAKTIFERQGRLWDENIGSEIQYLEAKTAFEQIDNAVDQMRSQLNKSVIYAPFSGKIDEVITDQGQVVSPGQTPIFRILNLGEMYVSANVPENYVGNINEGSEAIVTLSAIGKSFIGKVSQVSSNISESNRNFRVRVSIPDSIDFVKPNLIATLKLNDYTSKQAIVIPENILQENASGQSFTFSLQMENDSIGIANFRELKLGKSYQGEIEVLEGLKATDVVVTEGARTIKKDDKVRVLNFQKK